MVDGAAFLMGLMYAMYSQGTWKDERGVNVLDTGSPWCNVYETKDGKWLSVGAIEQRFYEDFVDGIGLKLADLPKQHDRKGWPELSSALPLPSGGARVMNGSACSRAAMSASRR